jgi:CHAT domain-containing protein/tetratricopeptide (TPR) repeat protein
MRRPQLFVLQGILLVFCLFWPATAPAMSARAGAENTDRNHPPEPVQGLFNPGEAARIPLEVADGIRLDLHLFTEARQVEATLLDSTGTKTEAFLLIPVGGVAVFSLHPKGPGLHTLSLNARLFGIKSLPFRLTSGVAQTADESVDAARRVLGLAGTFRGGICPEPLLGQLADAVAVFKKADLRQDEGMALFLLGEFHEAKGADQQALENFQSAEGVFFKLKRAEALCLVWERLSRLAFRLEKFDLVPAYLAQLMESRRKNGPPEALPPVLEEFGAFYRRFGKWERSARFFTEAATLYRTGNDPVRADRAQSLLGEVLVRFGFQADAVNILSRTIEGQIRSKDKPGAVWTSLRLGEALVGHSPPQVVRNVLDTCLTEFRETGDRFGEARTLAALALLEDTSGFPEKAVPLFLEALRVLPQTDEAFGFSFEFLLGLGDTERRAGRLVDAARHVETAIAGIERIRGTLTTDFLKVGLSDRWDGPYELLSRIRLEDYRAAPGQNRLEDAFLALEMGRARILVEHLWSGKAFQLKQKAVSAEQSRATLRLAVLDLALDGMADDPERAGNLARARDEAWRGWRDAMRKYIASQREFNGPNGRLQFQRRTFAELRELLDDDTVLVDFSVGKRDIIRWKMTRAGVEATTIPLTGTDLLGQIRELREACSERARSIRFETPEKRAERIALGDRRFPEVSAALGKALFGDLEGALSGKRLFLVGDGMLNFLPVAALRLPTSGKYLIEVCEPVFIPSLSFLAVLRRKQESRGTPTKTVRIVADPIFTAGDQRLKTSATDPEIARMNPEARRAIQEDEESTRDWPPTRLEFTRQEALSIAELTGVGENAVNLDLQAATGVFSSPDLKNFRILHIATHSFIHPLKPDFSGILLSLFDNDGRPVNGFMSAIQISELDLPFELVVLSSCRTALGQDVRGEGVLGIARSFHLAGAARVMASLWSVADESTSVLMADVYRGMLGPKKLRPAAALREAQLKMMKNPRWASPFYWAAFTIQGEPR